MSSLTPRNTAPYLPAKNTSCLLRVQRTAQHPHRENTHTPLSTLILLSYPKAYCTNEPKLLKLFVPCSLCALNFLCCMQIKRCPAAHIAHKKKNDASKASPQTRSGFLVYKIKEASLQARQTSFNTRKSTAGECQTIGSLSLPSFCCSPLSGRCGKVSGVFAGSPCQMAVVKCWGLFGKIDCR